MTIRNAVTRVFSPMGGGRAVVVWAHGGSFVGGSSAQWAQPLDTMARVADVTVVGVDYRLAPTWHHPTAVLDVFGVLRRLRVRHPGPLLVGGDSAGATIAFNAVLHAADRDTAPHGALLLYPPLDPLCRGASYGADPEAFPTAPYLRRAWRLYLDGQPSGVTPSPLLAAEGLLRRAPPTRIVVGVNDPVRDDCAHLTARLDAAGADVRCDTVAWLQHGDLLGAGAEADSALQEWLARAVCELVGEPHLEVSGV